MNAWTAPGGAGSLAGRPSSLFPSGEVATGFALACVLTRMFPRGRPVFYVAATLGATACLINGAHYLSDVGAGAMLGVLIAGPVFAYVEKQQLGLAARPRGT